MSLTDAQCRNAACPPGKTKQKFTDGAGLYLEVSPKGSKRWFWKFYPEGKESRLALGSYPEVSLKDARAARDAARLTRQSGANPVQQRKADKLAANVRSATTFDAVAEEFYAKAKDGWSPSYASKWHRLVEKDLSPWLGSLPLESITPGMLLSALQRTQQRGAIDSAHALRQYAGQVFRHGIQTERCTRNPAADLAGALKPIQVKHMGAVLDPVKLGALLRDIDGYAGEHATRIALALSALLFQRPGNIRGMEWAEIDTDAAMWTIPAAKMKRTLHGKRNGRPHLVPLAPQALALLADLRPLTGHGRYVFPSVLNGDACMSENTLRAALRRLGYGNDDMTPHGFRAVARTLIAERLTDIGLDVIEAQLAHGKSGPLGAAYDRADYMDQRRVMMVAWADYLDRLRVGGQVVQLTPKAA